MINDQGIWDRVGDWLNFQDLRVHNPDWFLTNENVISSLSPCMSNPFILVLQVLILNERGLWLKTFSWTEEEAADDIGTIITMGEEDTSVEEEDTSVKEEDTSVEVEESSVEEEDTSVAEKMAEKLAAEMLKEYRKNN